MVTKNDAAHTPSLNRDDIDDNSHSSSIAKLVHKKHNRNIDQAQKTAEQEDTKKSKDGRQDQEQSSNTEYITVSVKYSKTQVHYLQSVLPDASEEVSPIDRDEKKQRKRGEELIFSSKEPLQRVRDTNQSLMNEILGQNKIQLSNDDITKPARTGVFARMYPKEMEQRAA